jgi:hypothetical protein
MKSTSVHTPNPMPPRAPASAQGSARAPSPSQPDYTPTPDKRYFVVRGRLWRLSNPFLDPETHAGLVRELMSARRAVRDATSPTARTDARVRVDAAKRALGERGDPWWNDDAPDYNRRMAVNTPYATWYSETL